MENMMKRLFWILVLAILIASMGAYAALYWRNGTDPKMRVNAPVPIFNWGEGTHSN